MDFLRAQSTSLRSLYYIIIHLIAAVMKKIQATKSEALLSVGWRKGFSGGLVLLEYQSFALLVDPKRLTVLEYMARISVLYQN